MEDYYLNEEDSKVSLMMTTMWTNFVKYGNPTPDPDHGPAWEQVTADERR